MDWIRLHIRRYLEPVWGRTRTHSVCNFRFDQHFHRTRKTNSHETRFGYNDSDDCQLLIILDRKLLTYSADQCYTGSPKWSHRSFLGFMNTILEITMRKLGIIIYTARMCLKTPARSFVTCVNKPAVISEFTFGHTRILLLFRRICRRPCRDIRSTWTRSDMHCQCGRRASPC